MAERCKVYRVATQDLDRAVDDPALSLLLAQGWTVIAPIAVEENNQVFIALIMAPPKPQKHQIDRLLMIVLVVLVFTGICLSFYGVQYGG